MILGEKFHVIQNTQEKLTLVKIEGDSISPLETFDSGDSAKDWQMAYSARDTLQQQNTAWPHPRYAVRWI